jgi:hypothetical protein
MVRIFEINVDIGRAQWAMPTDSKFVLNGGLVFDGRPRMENWDPPEFYIQNPLTEKSDFYHIGSGCFAFSENIRQNIEAMDSLEMAGEFLPIRLETGENLYILNVTECINALDKNRSEYSIVWDAEKNAQVKGSVRRCVFLSDRLSGSPIFKIPELARAKVLTVQGWSGLECDSFIDVYEKQNFTGLLFDEMWKDES